MTQATTADVFLLGDFRLDLATGRLDRRAKDGEFLPVAIGARALEVLAILVQRAGQVVSKQDILSAVWPQTAVADGNLTVQISALRKVVDDGRTEGSCIKTVQRRGYRLTVPVTRINAEEQRALAIPARSEQPVPRRSIAVRPFACLSDDPELRQLAEQITNSIAVNLSRTAATSGLALDAWKLEGEPGCNYTFEGRVWSSRGRIRVNVHLVETPFGRYVWADQFDAASHDISEAEDEITGRLVRAINLQLLASETRRIESETRTPRNAGESTICGWAWVHRPWLSGTLQRARAEFEHGLEMDPGCIDTKIGLALTCVVQVLEGWSISPLLDQVRAETLLVEALECDPNRAMAYHAMGMLRRSQSRLSDARIALSRAVTLDPSDAGAVYQLGLAALYEGDPEAAVRHIQKSIRLSPHDPQISAMHYGLGRCYVFLRKNEIALEYFNQTLAAKPKHWDARMWRAGSLGLEGNLARARAEYCEATQLKPEISSLARWRAHQPWISYPSYRALRGETLYIGLRAAGMRDI